MTGEQTKARKRKTRQRAPRGTGTIFFHEGRQRWVGRKPVGRTATGTTKYREVWGETQGEVVQKLALAGPPGPDTTLSAWAERWLAGLQNKPATEALYRRSVRLHIGPRLGHLRVRDVTPSQVEQFVAGVRDTLGANSTRTVLSHLGNLFKSAVREGIIDRNPVSLARKPKAVKKDIDPFTPDELATIIRAAADAPCTYPVALLAAVGCRVGEAIALDVGDFDATTGRLSITRTYDPQHGMGTPKSANGVRTIRVPAAAVPVLVAAIGGRESGPLFVSPNGRRRLPQLIGEAFERQLKRLGMPYRNPHQLRHSVATALISAGEPPGDVARFLGDTVQTIVATYLHPAGTDPADTLDRLLGGRKVGAATGEARKGRKL